MGTKSKFFRAFVAGQTISDGRVITPEMISDIVATFNTDSYTPRINIEHISGYSPEPPFNGYGSVIAVKEQTDDITIAGKTEKRQALYCQVDGNDQLVALAARDQKPFPSVELTDSYAGTGKVGMLALAFTDNPASIATQALKFSRSGPGTVLAHGDAPAAIDFDTPVIQPDASAGAFAAMKAFFEKFTASPTPPAAPAAPTPPVQTQPATPANDNFAQLAEGLGLISASITALGAKVDTDVGAMRAEFGTLKTKLATTEEQNGFSRAPHAGGTVDAKYATDC